MGWLADLINIYDRGRRIHHDWRAEQPQLVIPAHVEDERPKVGPLLALSAVPLVLVGGAVAHCYAMAAHSLSVDVQGGAVDPPSQLVRNACIAIATISAACQLGLTARMLIRRRVRGTIACLLLSGSILSVGTTFFGYRLIAASTFIAEYSAFHRGVTLFDKKRFDAALAQFERILACAPESRVADNALGRIAGSHYWQGKYGEAVGECLLYLSMYPMSNISDNIRTTLRMAIGKFGSTHSDEACIELLKDVKLRYPNFELGFLQFLNLPADALSIPPENLPWLYRTHKGRTVTEQKRIRHFLRQLPSDRSAPLALFLLGEYRQLVQEYRGSYLGRVGLPAILKARYSEIGTDQDKAESLKMLLGEIDFALVDGHLDSRFVEDIRLLRARVMVRLGLYTSSLDELASLLASAAEPATEFESKAMRLFLGVAVLLRTDAEWESWRQTELGRQLLASWRTIESFVAIQRLAARGDYQAAWIHAEHMPTADVEPPLPVPTMDFGALENIAGILGRRDTDVQAFAERVLARAGECKAALYRDYPMEVFLVVPDSYYEINNLYLTALQGLPKDNNELLPIRAKLLELLFKTYPVRSARRRVVREECSHTYAKLAINSTDAQEKRDVLLRRAMIFLNNPWDLQSARECFRSFIDAYPQDSAANNALNWVAWSYCHEANQNLKDSGLYVALYEQAAAAYRELHDRYPNGHLARNALQADAIIRYKIGMVKGGLRKPYHLYRPGEVKIREMLRFMKEPVEP